MSRRRGAALALAVLAGCSTTGVSGRALPVARPSSAESRPAPTVALTGAVAGLAAPGPDRRLQSVTAEDGLHAVAAALGDFGTASEPLGRAPDGRFLRRIEVHGIGVSRWPAKQQPTVVQRRAARRFAAATVRAAGRYRDPAQARADGFVRVDRAHWVRAAAVDDEFVADPEHPESLLYAESADGPVLVGVMFLATDADHGPQMGGPLTAWHYHLFGRPLCMVGGGFPTEVAPADGACGEGVARTRSPEMLHVWLHNPSGRFDPGMDGAAVDGGGDGSSGGDGVVHADHE